MHDDDGNSDHDGTWWCDNGMVIVMVHDGVIMTWWSWWNYDTEVTFNPNLIAWNEPLQARLCIFKCQCKVRLHYYYDLTNTLVFLLVHLALPDKYYSTFYLYLTSGGEMWSNKGCKVADVNETHTTCECNHMSSFSLLVDKSKPNVSFNYIHDLTFRHSSLVPSSALI